MYNYHINNNHIIVEIDDKNYLIDTGSPVSFWINNPINGIAINNVKYPLNPKPYNLDINETMKCIGEEVDGFIGLDIIKQTSLTIYKNGLIDFKTNDIDGEEIKLNTKGFLSFNIGSNLMKGLFLIDTGAKYGYGVKGLFHNHKPFARVKDYNPIFKQLRSDIYHLDIVIAGKEKMIDVCDNEMVGSFLKRNSLLIIASVINLFDEACVINMNRKTMVLK